MVLNAKQEQRRTKHIQMQKQKHQKIWLFSLLFNTKPLNTDLRLLPWLSSLYTYAPNANNPNVATQQQGG